MTYIKLLTFFVISEHQPLDNLNITSEDRSNFNISIVDTFSKSATTLLFLCIFASRLQLELSSLLANILYHSHRLIFMLFFRIYLHQLICHLLKSLSNIISCLGTNLKVFYSLCLTQLLYLLLRNLPLLFEITFISQKD